MAVFIKVPVAQGSSSNEHNLNDLLFSDVTFSLFRPVSTATGSTEDRTSEQPSVGDVTAEKLRDKGDIKTVQTLLDRKSLGNVVISIVYTDKSYNREITLEDCLLSNWQQSSGKDGPATTELTFAFSAITIKDNMFDQKGNPTGPGGPTFDITTGQCR